MANDTIQVTVRLFAMLRARERSSTITMRLPSGATVTTLVDRFFSDRPDLVAMHPHIRVAQNGTLVARTVDLATLALRDGDELALLPPASGGAANGHTQKELASALVAAAEQAARDAGAARIWLRTAQDNTKAQRLYEKRGWKHDEVFRRYDLIF